MVGVDDTVFPEDPKYALRDLQKYFCHDLMLSNEIPNHEGLATWESSKKIGSSSSGSRRRWEAWTLSPYGPWL